MIFTKVRNLKYSKSDNATIDLLGTCEEYGEIPMTLNLVDTEDLHIFVHKNGTKTPLEQYCKSLKIAAYVEPEIIVVVPESISLRQAREVLIRHSLFNQIQSFIEQMQDPIQKLIFKNYWENSTFLERSHEVVLQMQKILNLTDQQLDNLFIEGSTL